MKLCDTCVYKNKYELEKPCVIYSDHCKLYEKDKGNIKAIIELDVPEFQIGQEVSIYFKDTMMIKGMVQEPKTGHWEWVQYDYNPKLGNWHCSKCKCVVIECVDKEEKGGIPLYKYCPQCGAKMQEVEI